MNQLIVGAGGIGSALSKQLPHALHWFRPAVDPTDEDSLMRASAALNEIDLAIVTTGMLHDEIQRPERALRELDARLLGRSFAINAIAPAMVARHVIPRMPRDRRVVFAALGARVGSIGDNRAGGWHAYRASKAALVMLIKTIAIETARRRPQAIVVTFHPGTVDTAMSKPFQGGVQPDKLFTADFAAERLLALVDNLKPGDSGGHFAWDGTRIPD